MAPDHYENFPVASRLLPASLRPAVAALYRYAREADDLADEGDLAPRERLQALQAYDTALEVLNRHRHDDNEAGAAIAWPPLAPAATFEPLRRAVRDHELPIEPLHRLLLAFCQDVEHRPPANRQALLHYCTRSANPVGELMLHLYRACTPRNLSWSNHICTGLQLVNFCQDIAIDQGKNRLYLPLDELQAHGLEPGQLSQAVGTPAWEVFMAGQLAAARQQLLHGAPLVRKIPGRAGWELRLVVLGGLRILERIEAVNYDVFRHRPTLRWPDWLLMASRIWRLPTQASNTPKMGS